MEKRIIQPLKFGEETIYIEVSDVNELGKEKWTLPFSEGCRINYGLSRPH